MSNHFKQATQTEQVMHHLLSLCCLFEITLYSASLDKQVIEISQLPATYPLSFDAYVEVAELSDEKLEYHCCGRYRSVRQQYGQRWSSARVDVGVQPRTQQEMSLHIVLVA